jgi:ubiquitin C-terminal hydrolase
MWIHIGIETSHSYYDTHNQNLLLRNMGNCVWLQCAYTTLLECTNLFSIGYTHNNNTPKTQLETKMWISIHDFIHGKQILAIPSSYIEIEKIFYMVVILTDPRCCKFGFTNLDAFIMICKNWPKDAQVGHPFTKMVVGEFFTSNIDLFEAHEKELTNLVTLTRICNCCNIFLLDMGFILTCLCNLHFEF